MNWLLFAYALSVAVAGFGLGFIAGYWRGRKLGSVDAYCIGFEHGQADGISTAAAAYESGGIVDAATGEIIARQQQ